MEPQGGHALCVGCFVSVFNRGKDTWFHDGKIVESREVQGATQYRVEYCKGRKKKWANPDSLRLLRPAPAPEAHAPRSTPDDVSAATPLKPPRSSSALESLCRMGFSDEAANKRCLDAANGRLEEAVGLLLAMDGENTQDSEANTRSQQEVKVESRPETEKTHTAERERAWVRSVQMAYKEEKPALHSIEHFCAWSLHAMAQSLGLTPLAQPSQRADLRIGVFRSSYSLPSISPFRIELCITCIGEALIASVGLCRPAADGIWEQDEEGEVVFQTTASRVVRAANHRSLRDALSTKPGVSCGVATFLDAHAKPVRERLRTARTALVARAAVLASHHRDALRVLSDGLGRLSTKERTNAELLAAAVFSVFLLESVTKAAPSQRTGKKRMREGGGTTPSQYFRGDLIHLSGRRVTLSAVLMNNALVVTAALERTTPVTASFGLRRFVSHGRVVLLTTLIARLRNELMSPLFDQIGKVQLSFLPRGVVLEIASFLGHQGLCSLSQTNRQMRCLMRNGKLWLNLFFRQRGQAAVHRLLETADSWRSVDWKKAFKAFVDRRATERQPGRWLRRPLYFDYPPPTFFPPLGLLEIFVPGQWPSVSGPRW